MKNIRTGVFETNSSSTHSVSICRDTTGIYDTIVPNEDGVLVLTGGEFGWEKETYFDAYTKANYAAVFCDKDQNMQNMLIEVLKGHTGAKDVAFDFSFDDYKHPNHSYIDHQSALCEGGAALEAFQSTEHLKDFIFNPRSSLTTDHDNH